MARPTMRIEGLAGFREGLRRDAADIEALVSLVSRKAALGVLGRVILASPVDTGRFRGNWQVDLNFTPSGVTAVLDKSGTDTIAAGAATISAAKAFGEIVMVNNLPYGPKLNDGYSGQAPSGFVEAAVDAELSAFGSNSAIRSDTRT